MIPCRAGGYPLSRHSKTTVFQMRFTLSGRISLIFFSGSDKGLEFFYIFVS